MLAELFVFGLRHLDAGPSGTSRSQTLCTGFSRPRPCWLPISKRTGRNEDHLAAGFAVIMGITREPGLGIVRPRQPEVLASRPADQQTPGQLRIAMLHFRLTAVPLDERTQLGCLHDLPSVVMATQRFFCVASATHTFQPGASTPGNSGQQASQVLAPELRAAREGEVFHVRRPGTCDRSRSGSCSRPRRGCWSPSAVAACSPGRRRRRRNRRGPSRLSCRRG